MKYPSANISSTKVGPFCQAFQLDGLDPLFAKMADRYMEVLISTFGTDHFYQADGSFTCHPMPWLATAAEEYAAEPASSVGAEAPPPPLPSHEAMLYSKAAYAGMARTDPKATWVYQTWGWHWTKQTADNKAYLLGWLSGVSKDKHLLLDQSAEMTAVWQFWDNWSFNGHPFIWCAMSSMGGNLGLYGTLTHIYEYIYIIIYTYMGKKQFFMGQFPTKVVIWKGCRLSMTR